MSDTNKKNVTVLHMVSTVEKPIYAIDKEKNTISDKVVGTYPANADIYIFNASRITNANNEATIIGQVDYEGLFWVYMDTTTDATEEMTKEAYSNLGLMPTTLNCPARSSKKKADLFYGPGEYYLSQRIVQKGEKFTANMLIGDFVMVDKTIGNNTTIHGFMKRDDLYLDMPQGRGMRNPIIYTIDHSSPDDPAEELVETVSEPEEPDDSFSPRKYDEKEGLEEKFGYHPPVEAREATDQPIAILSFPTKGSDTRLTDFLSSMGLSGSMDTHMSVIHQNDEVRFKKYSNLFPSILGLGCKYFSYIVVPEVDAIRLKKLFLTKGFRPTVHTMYNA